MMISLFIITGSLSAQSKQYIEIQTSAQCATCKAAIEKAVGAIEGVKIVAVKYDSEKTNVAAIKSAITTIGYDADEVPADAKAYEELHSCCKKE